MDSFEKLEMLFGDNAKRWKDILSEIEGFTRNEIVERFHNPIVRDWVLRMYDYKQKMINTYPNPKSDQLRTFEIEFRNDLGSLVHFERVKLNDESELKFKTELIAVDLIKKNKINKKLYWKANEVIVTIKENVGNGKVYYPLS